MLFRQRSFRLALSSRLLERLVLKVRQVLLAARRRLGRTLFEFLTPQFRVPRLLIPYLLVILKLKDLADLVLFRLLLLFL
jgi:hypothetical protein